MKTTKRVSYDKIVIHKTWTDDTGVVHNYPSSEEKISYDNDIDVPELTSQERQDGKKVDIQFVTGAEAVGSVVESVIMTARGELQMNQNRGIPYLDNVLGDKSRDQVSDWAGFAQDAIIGTNGVRSIKAFAYGIEKVGKRRVLSYDTTIETDYGVTSVGDGNSADTIREIRYQEPTLSPNPDYYTFTAPEFAYAGAGSSNAAFVRSNKSGIGGVVAIEYRLSGSNSWTQSVPDIAGIYDVRAQVANTVRFDAGYVTSSDWVFEVYDASKMRFSTNENTGRVANIRMTTSEGGFVLWGDGTRTDVSGSGTQYASHTYSDYGDYDVYVVGVNWFAIGDDRESSDDTSLMVSRFYLWGKDVTSAAYTFAGCTNLVQSEIPSWNDSMTNVEYCYYGCEGLGNA